MKKLIFLMMIAGLMAQPAVIKAQGAASSASTLSPQVKAIIQNVKTECGLNPTQTTKFTTDYVTFLNNNAKNLAENANNPQKRDEETKKQLLLTTAKFRSYLNDGQFSKLTAMIQAGKLDPAKQTTGSTSAAAAGQQVAVKAPAPLPAAVSVQSNVTSIYQQLAPYIKTTAEQTAKVVPILKEYDQKSTAIKTANTGNDAKIRAGLSQLNSQTISKLHPVLNQDQLQKLVLAVTMQENVLSGKNLSMDQRAFIDKLRNDYKLNDVQLMAVILIMVEGKIRGDIIHQAAKGNPQGAATELGNLMQDLDGRLKNALSAEQYTNVKADLEKLIRGQRI